MFFFITLKQGIVTLKVTCEAKGKES